MPTVVFQEQHGANEKKSPKKKAKLNRRCARAALHSVRMSDNYLLHFYRFCTACPLFFEVDVP